MVKKDQAFSIISEVNEALYLSNNPQQILNMALDTLCEVLKVDCCWVQLVNLPSQALSLVAYRGFTPAVKRRIDSMGFSDSFVKQVVGLGQVVIIPDLSRDREHDLASLRKAGLASLIAVPMRTYGIHGALGIATRAKMRSQKGISELLKVIASMLIGALNKAKPYQKIQTGGRRTRALDQFSPGQSTGHNRVGHQLQEECDDGGDISRGGQATDKQKEVSLAPGGDAKPETGKLLQAVTRCLSARNEFGKVMAAAGKLTTPDPKPVRLSSGIDPKMAANDSERPKQDFRAHCQRMRDFRWCHESNDSG